MSTPAIKPKSNFFRASAEDFDKIPGSPIAYWVSKSVSENYKYNKLIKDRYPVCPGIRTGKDSQFLRFWFEIAKSNTQYDLMSFEEMDSNIRWFPLHKGGTFRKWYGNAEHVVDLFNNAYEIRTKSPDFRLRDKKWYFKKYISWSRITSAMIAFRYYPRGVLFSDAGPGIFAEDKCTDLILMLNSKITNYLLKIINPTLNFQKQDIELLPFTNIQKKGNRDLLISTSKSDWDSYETSWDFTVLPLLQPELVTGNLQKTYSSIRQHWLETTLEMRRLEKENNRIFIEAYGLEDELTPNVPLKEITLTCNPYYRYGVDADKSVESDTFPLNKALEDRLQSDTMKELVSYAVGCMFGRYSLDKEGLILANSGDGIDEYMHLVPEPRFMPDESGILPLTEADDFTDDLPTQFYKFLRASFGEENFHENLRFIEDSIGKSVRQYFLRDFFKDHVQRYKKRPVYWQVTSPNGSFRAFIYLHRYTKDTVGQVLNDYVRPFEKKLESRVAECRHISTSSSTGTKEKIQAQKDVDRFEKALQEITEWDANVLRPLALKRIELDLDDGVKVNYAKLGDILEPVVGLNR